MTDFERLNDINQRVWEQGFTANNLRDLETLSEDIKNGAAVFERIPYAQQSGLSKGSEVLCAASIICRGCPRTESETRQIYDTDDLFGEGRIQEYLVETWARLSSGSMPQLRSTSGCTMPAPSSSIQPSPWQVEQV